MRKRILSFALVFALVCTMSISAFAGSAYDDGFTDSITGGGVLYCQAHLDVDSSRAYATTTNDQNFVALCTTVATIYYLDDNGTEVPETDQGRGSISVYGVPTKGVRGGSYHLVSGGSMYGAWSCTLYANK